MVLNDRKLNILATIVKSFIETGEPVGSKMLSDNKGLNLSSATIRNEMSELAEMNLLEQPHTSAGRVPTPLGYRLYIEKLMDRYQLTEEDKKQIDIMLPSTVDDPEKLINMAGQALSELTRCTVISTTPADKDGTVKRVELFQLSKNTVMIILVTSSGIVKSRNSKAETEFTNMVVERFAKIVSEHVYGLPLSDFTTGIIQTLAVAAGDMVLTMTPLIVTLHDIANDVSKAELRLMGESKILHHRDISVEKARELLEFLSHRQAIMSVLSTVDRELTVLIGGETGEKALISSSMVMARYHKGVQEFGSIGVIGPYRMDYEHIIPSIEYFAESVGRLLADALVD